MLESTEILKPVLIGILVSLFFNLLITCFVEQSEDIDWSSFSEEQKSDYYRRVERERRNLLMGPIAGWPLIGLILAIVDEYSPVTLYLAWFLLGLSILVGIYNFFIAKGWFKNFIPVSNDLFACIYPLLLLPTLGLLLLTFRAVF